MKKNTLLIAFFLMTVSSIFLFYFHTIFFAVKSFDEVTPFKETILPVCFSFSEIFDLISLLGLHQYFEASNTLYSSIISLRSNPVGDFLVLITQFFCRKNPINYHLYSLILHSMSSCFVFLILNKISLDFISKLNSKLRLITVSLLTFLWATHPVNIESVLLLTNYNAVLSYTLCIITIYIYLSYHSNTVFRTILLSTIFFFATFSAEYLFMLPFVLFSYTLAKTKDVRHSLIQISPLLAISILFILSFLFSSSKINFQEQSMPLSLERIFWFSPQVICHLIKLLIFPVKLSIDQSFFVKFGETLFSPYAFLCIGAISLILILSLVSLFKSKQSFLFLICIPFLFSLTPFAHIFAPTYNIASERYLYLPSFIFILGLSDFIFHSLKSLKNKNFILFLSLLTLLTLTYSTRAFIRTLDWKDSFSLYEAAINATKNPLYKAFRYKLLTPQEKIFSKFEHQEVSPVYQQLAIDNLELAIKDFKERTKEHENRTPLIIKSYGLDPETLLIKAAYLLAHSDYTINKDPVKALNILNPFLRDLSLLDNAGLAFYASLHFFNNSLDKAEEILRYAHKKYPYSTRITFPLCQLIYMKTGDINEVEKLSLISYKYFPYDTFTLLYLIKVYMIKKDNEKYAFFSYAYGLRHHSIESLQIARDLYLVLNKTETAKKIERNIQLLQTKLSKKSIR